MSITKIRANIAPLYDDDANRRNGKVHISAAMADKILSRDADANGDASSIGKNLDRSELQELVYLDAALQSGAHTADAGVAKRFRDIVNGGVDKTWAESVRDAQSYKFLPSALLGVALDSFVQSKKKPD
jgi:hypothetical protein